MGGDFLQVARGKKRDVPRGGRYKGGRGTGNRGRAEVGRQMRDGELAVRVNIWGKRCGG